MREILIYVFLGLTFLNIVLSLCTKKIGRAILCLLFTGIIYGSYYFFNKYFNTHFLFEYVDYFLLAYDMVCLFIFFKSIKIKENISEFKFYELEKENEKIKDEANLLRERFIKTISLVDEGLIFFNDDYQGMFLSDNAKKILGASKNEITIEEHESLIVPEDRKNYNLLFSKANKNNPNYEVKYRVVINNRKAWVIEKGSLFYTDGKAHLISKVKIVDTKVFPTTSLEELDSLPNDKEYLLKVESLIKNNISFSIAIFELSNLPEINKSLGREVGNMMIAEYIKKLRYHFAKEEDSIFRLTGIQFAVIMVDKYKYDTLHRALVTGGELVNLSISVGGIEAKVIPSIGVVSSFSSVHFDTNEITSTASKMLDEAIRSKKKYHIFGE